MKENSGGDILEARSRAITALPTQLLSLTDEG
jgi:hypothetical protein